MIDIRFQQVMWVSFNVLFDLVFARLFDEQVATDANYAVRSRRGKNSFFV